MPVNEEELLILLSEQEGREVTPEELQEFLHEHFTYAERIGQHDVLNCDRCKAEVAGQR